MGRKPAEVERVKLTCYVRPDVLGEMERFVTEAKIRNRAAGEPLTSRSDVVELALVEYMKRHQAGKGR